MSSELEYFIVRYEGPMAVVRGCRCCKWVDSRRKFSGVGRGNGFREGNMQRGRAIQHAKHCDGVRRALTAAGVPA